ncbi:MAG: hypothetical protein HY697_01960 [Deltaproteobacteria bacterium]|nr:hypothetical protein [Deltaproteobacteria bacterium]
MKDQDRDAFDKSEKEIVVEDFCEPLSGPQKDECISYYEDWEEEEKERKKHEEQE